MRTHSVFSGGRLAWRLTLTGDEERPGFSLLPPLLVSCASVLSSGAWALGSLVLPLFVLSPPRRQADGWLLPGTNH